MNTDAATKTWLIRELTSALGFAEVEDIASYVLTSFSSKQEVTGYLTELLGISPTRAETISAQLFAAAPSQSRQQQQQQQTNARSGKKHGKSNASGAASDNAGAAMGLVPQAAAPNSRIKTAKPRKTGAPPMMHTHIINCLQCGKIEHNGGRACTFCHAELRYEELDEHEIDHAAQQHMETLVMYDETSAERTTVIDADEQNYEEVVVGGSDDDSRSRRAVTLDLDLESRQFVVRGGSNRVQRNNQLTKEAREICESVQRRLDKAPASTTSSRTRGTPASGQHGEASPAVKDGALWRVDDSNAPELLFV